MSAAEKVSVSDAVEMSPASTPSEKATEAVTLRWDGFADPYWNLGQAILWAAHRKHEHVDAASDRSGSYGSSYGLAAAAVQIEEQVSAGRAHEHLVEEICQRYEDVVEEIRQKAMHDELKGYDYSLNPPKELPSANWLKLRIDSDAHTRVPFVRWCDHSNVMPDYDVRFTRTSVLQCFPEPGDVTDEKYYDLPDKPPRQQSLQIALKGLLLAYPAGRVPERLSAERLAQIASAKTQSAVTREAVLRVLGRKK
jgi:hypothetical protein